VGSFVWSYLKNLQETALPSKAELQGLVADEKLSKKFSTDFRKFSRNLEISSFYDDFNFGKWSWDSMGLREYNSLGIQPS